MSGNFNGGTPEPIARPADSVLFNHSNTLSELIRVDATYTIGLDVFYIPLTQPTNDNVILLVKTKMRDNNGKLIEPQVTELSVTNNTGGVNRFTVGVGREGYIESVHVNIIGYPVTGNFRIHRGEMYVNAYLQRGLSSTAGSAVIVANLIRNYIETGNSLSYPLDQTEGYTEGGVASQVIYVGDPGPGDEISYQLTPTQTWELQAIFFKLTTEATVANRRVRLTIADAGLSPIFTVETVSANQAASTTWDYNYNPNGSNTSLVLGYILTIPPLLIPPEFVIFTDTENIQGLDQYTDIKFLVKQYILPYEVGGVGGGAQGDGTGSK